MAMKDPRFVGQAHRLPKRNKGRRSACPTIFFVVIAAGVLTGSRLSALHEAQIAAVERVVASKLQAFREVGAP